MPTSLQVLLHVVTSILSTSCSCLTSSTTAFLLALVWCAGRIHLTRHVKLYRTPSYFLTKYLGGAVRPIMCCCRLQSCCCCALREGSIAIGIIDLILSVLGLGWNVWPVAASGVASGYSFGNIAVYAISILFSILLILGAVQNNACLCLAWIIWSSICLVLNIALVAWLCFAAWGVSVAGAAAAQSSALGAAVIGVVGIAIYVAIAILAVIIFFLIYGIMVVNSFRQELNESGGYASSYPMQAV